MSSNSQETIVDIVADIRAQNQGLPEDDYALSPLVADLLSFADRIEAANKREKADEKRISDAVVQSLRDRKLEMAREIAAKDEEIARLRALVKEFADVLNDTKNYTCFGCTIRDCPGEHECRYTKKYCLLIAKAREVIGGTE